MMHCHISGCATVPGIGAPLVLWRAVEGVEIPLDKTFSSRDLELMAVCTPANASAMLFQHIPPCRHTATQKNIGRPQSAEAPPEHIYLPNG